MFYYSGSLASETVDDTFPKAVFNLNSAHSSNLSFSSRTPSPSTTTKHKSKSIVNKVKNKTIAKVRKKIKSGLGDSNNDFDKSESTLDSTNTNDSERRRRRGRSLGLKKNADKDDRKSVKEGNHKPVEPRQSRSQTKAAYNNNTPQDRQMKRMDRKVRQRSQSIVKDAQSLIAMIDNGESCSGTLPRRSSEESVESRASTVIACGSTRNLASSDQRPVRDLRSRADPVTNDAGVAQRTHSLDESENIKSLQETNDQYESKIKSLQDQVDGLTNERNALKVNSDRMMEVTTKQYLEIEKDLRSERKALADASSAHKQEIEEWKKKAESMEQRCKDAEGRWKSVQEKEVRALRETVAANGPLGKEASLLASALGISTSSLFTTNSDAASQSQSDLHHAILKLSEMEAGYNSQIRQLQSDKESMKSQANDWKQKRDQLDTQHQELLAEREGEAAVVNSLECKLEGCRVVIESMKKEREEKKGLEASDAGVVNDDVLQKISDLADENGRLESKCQRLERDLAVSKSSLETSVDNLTRDLESMREKNNEATELIETLEDENSRLRVTFANQGEKSNRHMKSIMRSLRRSSFSSTGDAGSIADTVLLDDDEDNYDENKKPSKPIEEMNQEEALAYIQNMQAENETLRESMEEAIQIATGTHDKMADFFEKHGSSVEDYKARLDRLNEEHNEMRLHNKRLSSELKTLRRENTTLNDKLKEANNLVVSSLRDEVEKEKLEEENERLRKSLKEMNCLVTTAEECVDELKEKNASLEDEQNKLNDQRSQELKIEREANEYLRAEIENVSSERQKAYDTCKVLQNEINLLRKSLKESKMRVDKLTEDNASITSASATVKESQEKITEQINKLTKRNESLVKELEQKNQALQAVQAALEALKVEQGTIKKTIDDLSAENEKLRNAPEATLRRQASGSHGSGSDGSQIIKLEKGIKRCEKENKGLREANATLSAKLFDEMEKTDALRVANEGLAARICKLVAFIQQNPGASGEGTSSVSSQSAGSVKSKNKVPPAPPKRPPKNRR